MNWILRECGGSAAKAATVTWLGGYWIIGTLLLALTALFPTASTALSHALTFPVALNALLLWVLIPGSWLTWYFTYRSMARSAQRTAEALEAFEALNRYAGRHQTAGETL